MNDIKMIAKGDAKVTIEADGKRYQYIASSVYLDEDVNDNVILSDYSMYPVARVVDRTYTIRAIIDPYKQVPTRPVASIGKKNYISPNRVYTTVEDLSVESITYAKELVGAKDRDIFEIEEHENGYKLTWEIET